MKEKDIDDILAALASLKDGQNDDLGRILTPAILALKEFRRSRIVWRNLRSQLTALRKQHKDSMEALQKMQGVLFPKKKK